MAPGQDVQMQVSDGLTSVGPLVDDDAIALSVALEARADAGSRREELGFQLRRRFGIELREMLSM